MPRPGRKTENKESSRGSRALPAARRVSRRKRNNRSLNKIRSSGKAVPKILKNRERKFGEFSGVVQLGKFICELIPAILIDRAFAAGASEFFEAEN